MSDLVYILPVGPNDTVWLCIVSYLIGYCPTMHSDLVSIGHGGTMHMDHWVFMFNAFPTLKRK